MNFDCPYCKQEGIESTVTCDGNVDHRSVEGSANYKHYFVLRKEEEEELLKWDVVNGLIKIPES